MPGQRVIGVDWLYYNLHVECVISYPDANDIVREPRRVIPQVHPRGRVYVELGLWDVTELLNVLVVVEN